MPWMYVLAVQELPSPWSYYSSYNGKHLKFGSTHGTTGGSDSHRHTVLDQWSGYSAAGSIESDAQTNVMATHRHVVKTTNGVTSYSDNDPLYVRLRLYRIDYDVWRTTIKTFPVGTILASSSALSSAGLVPYTGADDRIIKISSTMGGTGGRSSHSDHSFSVTLESTGGVGVGGIWQADPKTYVGLKASHGHSASRSSVNGGSSLPARVVTRLYNVTSAMTEGVPVGTVVFFDGSPGDNWSYLSSWEDRYLSGGGTNPSFVGSNDHWHYSGSFSASSYSATEWHLKPGTVGRCVPSHSHALNVGLNESNHEPSFVTVVPYLLVEEIPYVEIVEKKMDSSSRFKISRASPVSASVRLIGDQSNFITASARFLATGSKSRDVSALFGYRDVPEGLDSSALFKLSRWKMSVASALFVKRAGSIGVSAAITRRPAPPGPYLDAILKSWVEQFDSVQMLAQGMSWANKISSAVGLELDEKWGVPFRLPRYTDESDGDYRRRLIVWTETQVGCGTRSSIERIVDSIIGLSGSCNVGTYAPGEVDVRFSDDAVRRASDDEWLIRTVVERSLAAGISYNLWFSLSSLSVSARMMKGLSVPLAVSAAILAEDVSGSVDVSSSFVSRASESVDVGSIFMAEDVPASIGVETWIMARRTYPTDTSVRLKKGVPSAVDCSSRFEATVPVSLSATSMVRRYSVPKTVPVTSRMKGRNQASRLVRTRISAVVSGGLDVSTLISGVV